MNTTEENRTIEENPKVQRHMDICLELNETYAKKNHDYGDSFHETWKEEAYAMARIRLSDKLNRFKKLSRNAAEGMRVSDESMRDTLLDLANYAIMTVMEMDISAEEELAKMKKADMLSQSTSVKICPICDGRVMPLPENGFAQCQKCGSTFKISNSALSDFNGESPKLTNVLEDEHCPKCGNIMDLPPFIDETGIRHCRYCGEIID